MEIKLGGNMKKRINILSWLVIILLIVSLYISFNIERNKALRNWLSEHLQKTEIVTMTPSVYFLGLNNLYQESNHFVIENPNYVNLDWLKEIDLTYHYDELENTLSVMWQDHYLVIENEDTILINGKKVEQIIDFKFVNGSVYVPFDALNQLEGFNKLGIASRDSDDLLTRVITSDAIKYSKTSCDQISFLFQDVEQLNHSYLSKEYPTLLDIFTTIQIVDKIKKNDELISYEVNEETVLVYNGNTIGYTLKKVLKDTTKANEFIYYKEDYYTGKDLIEEPIFLVWEAVYNKNPKTSQIPAMNGVNVLSPTWLELEDAQGNFSNNISKEYIRWSHENSYDLWILVTNGFDPDLTHNFLNNYKSRQRFINDLISLCIENQIDGINIDFENIYIEDKEILSHFINELAWATNKFNLVLSMDVTVMGGSDNWSKCFDRKALGKAVDYLVIMTYDEYWASSPISGPVSSYDWVENSMLRIMEEVPGRKLVMGLPFYTRIWTEKISNEQANKVDVSSNSIGIVAQNNLIQEKGLTPIWNEQDGLFFVSYIEEDVVKKIWIENDITLSKKASLVKELGLKGVACWRRGLEEETVYKVISNEIFE